MTHVQARQRYVRIWLLTVTFLIVTMIGLGGLTRLTRSGLSIVEWKPIAGVIPPLTDEDWHVEFEKYKQYPEYKHVNKGMELAEFKTIFYWEYAHRLLGRIIGLAFLIPMLVFLFWRQLSLKLSLRLTLVLALGGVQAALGWFMVKSGLVSEPRVSHFRLAAHLLCALVLMSAVFWLAQDQRLRQRFVRRLPSVSRGLKLFLGLLFLQIFYGALTAGLRAGFMYNTFPTMNGFWIPPGLLAGGMWGMLNDPVMVQFIHRTLGWAVLFYGLLLAWRGYRSTQLTRVQRVSLLWIGGFVLMQFSLGVATLVGNVPISLGALHQLGACFVLLATIRALYLNRVISAASRI